MPDDVARCRAAQPEHGRRDLLGPPRPADGTCFAVSAYTRSSPLNTSRPTCVSIRPGLIAFTRMPCFTYSSAAVRVRPTTPCLDAMYEPMPGLPVRAPTDALLT